MIWLIPVLLIMALMVFLYLDIDTNDVVTNSMLFPVYSIRSTRPGIDPQDAQIHLILDKHAICIGLSEKGVMNIPCCSIPDPKVLHTKYVVWVNVFDDIHL